MILSKHYDIQDYLELAQIELKLVDAIGIPGQHKSRRWEYAMALHALDRWCDLSPAQTRRLVDVGGAGSGFTKMAHASSASWLCSQVDPTVNCDLETYLTSRPPLADAVTCISVIEHVKDLHRFVYHLSCLVAPGGLLFLTMDSCDDQTIGEPTDVYHWHWMRERIFNAYMRGGLSAELAHLQCFPLGGFSDEWHGPIENWGYAPASLCLRKRA